MCKWGLYNMNKQWHSHRKRKAWSYWIFDKHLFQGHQVMALTMPNVKHNITVRHKFASPNIHVQYYQTKI